MLDTLAKCISYGSMFIALAAFTGCSIQLIIVEPIIPVLILLTVAVAWANDRLEL